MVKKQNILCKFYFEQVCYAHAYNLRNPSNERYAYENDPLKNVSFLAKKILCRLFKGNRYI